MGAENISYIAVFPSPIPQRKINAMRKYLVEVKQFIEAYEKHQDVFPKNRAGCDHAAYLNMVSGFCLQMDLKLPVETRRRIAWAWLDSDQPGEGLEYPECLDNDPPYGTGYRDSASRTVKLDKKTWDIIQAGEMSWGDEPEGEGYQELKQAFRWGVVEMLGGQ